ncbi:hypothetical protein LGL55_07365 [Clostridium tagluense]|uniref:hypothetical protein n=1 Tax=Clostridium tagluense TaxID=360422 RepID=UPI001C0DB880|nr:hypothetical protein [Clostridium tagluense]MBU3129736.1 hypothetical protein [Clostridium tagluense]MCB2310852.1 hypothetical protein [Clostridium tagluense]MCB2315706.1 hypothetical protein [Clostridium tagluense]MCB2320650.1 hypothetical protein [Clostridium tagluense]MCB2325445.1 hypothetical protein [Clostridium tagluense]
MNYLDKLAKNIEFNGKKQKVSNHKNFLALAVVGVAIGGAAVALFTKNCSRETKKNVTNNLEDNNRNIKKDIDEDASIVEDINLNRDEIEDTLKNVGEESIGDVGIAMEHALEDDYDEKQNEDKN